MKRLIITAVIAVAIATLFAAPANATGGGYQVTYTFYTNSGDLDYAYTRADGGTYARTNRRFTNKTRSGVYKWRKSIIVSDDYFTPSSRLSTDEPEDYSWVECYIQENGVTKYHQYSSGPYASVYC